MDVTMAMILDRLKREVNCVPGTCFDPSFPVLGAYALVPVRSITVDPNVCCITTNVEEAKNENVPLESIILIDEKGDDERNCSIVVTQDVGILDIRNLVERIIDSYVLWANDLLSLTVHGAGLEELVDFAHNLFQNPITIIDTNFRMLAYTHNDMMDDFLWVTEEDFDDEARVRTKLLKEREFIEYFDVIKKKGFLFNYVAKTGAPVMACGIRTGSGAAYALNIVQKHHAFTEGEFQCMKYFAQIVEVKIKAIEATWFASYSGYIALLHDIVRGNLVEAGDIKARLSKEWMSVLPMFTVAIVALREGFMKYHELCRLQDEIERLLPEGVCVIHSRTLVVFINHEPGFDAVERLESLNYLHKRMFIVGVSESRFDDCSLHDLVRQAQAAVRIGRFMFPDRILVDFGSCRYLYLIDMISQEKDWQRCLHPALSIIEDHDEQAPASKLMPTLECLMENHNNRMNTAMSLSIQRNTLQYRISKIEQLCGIDLSDAATFDDILFSTTLRDYKAQNEA